MGLRFLTFLFILSLTIACTRPPLLLEEAQILNLEKSDYILVGERHPNPCDHLVQIKILDTLLARNLKPTIGLEMVAEDKQDILDAYLENKISFQELPQKLAWQKRWGYDFKLYAPIFKKAKTHKLKLVALNLPKSILKKWSQNKKLSPYEQNFLPYFYLGPSDKQKTFLEEQFKQHQNFLPQFKVNLISFLKAQALWESKMAEKAFLAKKKYNSPLLIYIGSGHLEADFGLQRRLKLLDPKATIITFLPGSKQKFSDGTYYYNCPNTNQKPTSPLGLSFDLKGNRVIITEVKPKSKAYKAGFKKQDIILEVNDKPIKSLLDLHKIAITAKKNKQPLIFKIRRKKSILTLTIN